MAKIIELNQVSKIYSGDNGSAIGIQNVSASFSLGEFVAITGESGSGKSTFLNVVSLLDSYEEGELFIDGKSTIEFNKQDFQKYQSNYVSFVFQEYNLIESFSVIENVLLPLTARGIKGKEARNRAKKALEQVGLDKISKRRASKLSGGEKQRVVIARSLVSDTPVFACDEPTGNLDSKTSQDIVKVFKDISKDKLILYVTHDFDSIKDIATRHIVLKDGHIVKDVQLSKVKSVDNPIQSKKKNTSFFSLFSTAIKSVAKTPKRTVLSGIVALAISLASFGLLWGANSVAGAAMNNVVVTSKSYLDDLHTPNRVPMYDVGRSESKITDITLTTNAFLDKGNLLSSFPYFYQIDNRSSTIVNHGVTYDELPIIFGTNPTKENEIAIGIPKTTIDSMGSKLENYIKGVYLDKDFSFSAFSSSFLSSSNTFHISGIYSKNDETNNNLISLIFSSAAAQKFTERTLALFNSSQRFRDFGTMGSIYTAFPQISLVIGDKLMTTDNDIFTNNHPADYTKIYVNPNYSGRDLQINYRNTRITVPSKELISNGSVSSVALSYPALQLLLQKDVKFASVFTKNNTEAKNVMESAIEVDIDATVASIPQASNTSINVGNLIMAIVYAILFIGMAILFCFIGSLLFGLIYSSKKKDYAILMTLSFSKKDIRLMNIFEMLIYFIVSSLISYGIFYLIGNILTTTSNANVAESIFRVFSSVPCNIIYFVFNVLFAVLVSTWMLKRMNKKSRASNMRKDNTLL